MESTIYHDEYGREMEFDELVDYLIDKGKRQAYGEMRAKRQKKEKPAENIIPLFYDYGQLAQLLNYERKKIERMNKHEELPAPFAPEAKRPRWLRTEIEAWVKAGMPAREKWEEIKAMNNKRR